MEAALFKFAFVSYAHAAVLAIVCLFVRKERFSRWVLRFMGVGLAFHLASFGVRVAGFWSLEANRFFLPTHTLFGFLSWLALATGLIFFIVEGVARLNILGAFVLPWTLLAAGAALMADPSLGSLPSALRSYNIHPLIVMLADAGLINAFGVGIAFLVAERQIKSRRPMELCYRLPSLEELDRLHYRIVAAAFPVLTIGILMGVQWAHHAWAKAWSSDPKVLWSTITWAVYGGLLLLRRFRNLKGRRWVQLSMVGFACVLYTLFGASYVSRLHAFLSPG